MSDYPLYRLNFSQLSYFISAAKHLNFSRAAEECHVVPNVISKQISKLETMLGIPVFNRIGKRVELTDAGKILYKCALDITDRFEKTVDKMEEYDPSINMRLQLGYYDIWSESFISPIIRDFKARYPDAHVTINYINMPQALPHLNNGFLDVVIMSPFNKPDKSDNIDSFVLASSPINLVVSNKHPFSKKDEISLSELKDEYFTHLLLASSDTRNLETALGAGNSIKMNIDKYYALGLEQSKNMHNIFIDIKSGVGFGFMPEASKDYTETIGVKFIKIKEPVGLVSTHVIWKTTNSNPTLDLFLNIAREHISI